MSTHALGYVRLTEAGFAASIENLAKQLKLRTKRLVLGPYCGFSQGCFFESTVLHDFLT